jgi:hypothetical protein
MRPITIILQALALLVFLPGIGSAAEEQPRKVFACRIGPKIFSVTEAAGRLTYRYGTKDKDEIAIVGAPESKNVFKMIQRFAGMEYQLRFARGDFSYTVYSVEGNGNTGASSTSGLVVTKGTKRISDKQCAPFADVRLPENSQAIPDDDESYSAM